MPLVLCCWCDNVARMRHGCSFHVHLLCTHIALQFFSTSELTVGAVFAGREVSIQTWRGWELVVAYGAACALVCVLLPVIVERAKKCLDFVVTLHALHLVLVALVSGFPTHATWWLMVILYAVLMTLVGEFLCMRRETRSIQLNSKLRQVAV